MRPIYTIRPAEERFWNKVDRSGGPDACWPWLAALNGIGYGVFGLPRRGSGNIGAHRFAYELLNGPIPAGLFVCHRCDVRHCCNPRHLFLGTNSDNMRDCARKGRCHPGEQNAAAKMTAEQVQAMRALHADGNTMIKDIAAQFGLSPSATHNIIRRKTWQHVP